MSKGPPPKPAPPSRMTAKQLTALALDRADVAVLLPDGGEARRGLVAEGLLFLGLAALRLAQEPPRGVRRAAR